MSVCIQYFLSQETVSHLDSITYQEQIYDQHILLAVLKAMVMRTLVICNIMLCHLRLLEFPYLTLLISISATRLHFQKVRLHIGDSYTKKHLQPHLQLCLSETCNSCHVFSPSCVTRHVTLHHSLSCFLCPD